MRAWLGLALASIACATPRTTAREPRAEANAFRDGGVPARHAELEVFGERLAAWQLDHEQAIRDCISLAAESEPLLGDGVADRERVATLLLALMAKSSQQLFRRCETLVREAVRPGSRRPRDLALVSRRGGTPRRRK